MDQKHRYTRFISFFIIRQTVQRPLTPSNLIIGSEGRLAVVVRKYTPHVACGDKFPQSGHPRPCQVTLNRLPVSSIPMIFGPKGALGTQWSVPWSYTASTYNFHIHRHVSLEQDSLTVCLTPKTGGSICTASVNISENVQHESMKWVDIWAAAVAVDASE